MHSSHLNNLIYGIDMTCHKIIFQSLRQVTRKSNLHWNVTMRPPQVTISSTNHNISHKSQYLPGIEKSNFRVLGKQLEDVIYATMLLYDHPQIASHTITLIPKM